MSSFAIRYLDFLHSALSTPSGTWYITRKPEIWFLPHTHDEDYLEDPEILSTYKLWSDKLPLVFSLDKWILDDNRSLKGIYHGRGIERTVAEEFGIHPAAPAELCPEKRCIEYYLDYESPANSGWAPSMELSSIQGAMDVVQEKNFEINGDIFVRHVTFYHQGDIQHDLFVIYIPIK